MKILVAAILGASLTLAGGAAMARTRPHKPVHKATVWRTMPGGLKYDDVKVGKGAVAKKGETVTVNYTGWLMNGKKFDSSLNPGRTPFSFTLGAGQVIRGWDEGVAGMHVGGRRILIIPPSLGYGATGTPGGPIPPNATLKFQVDLLSVK